MHALLSEMAAYLKQGIPPKKTHKEIWNLRSILQYRLLFLTILIFQFISSSIRGL